MFLPGCPAGRTGDWGDRTKFNVLKFYVPVLVPRMFRIFAPLFAPKNAPKLLRIFRILRAWFPGKSSPLKIHQKDAPSFNAKFPGKPAEKILIQVSCLSQDFHILMFWGVSSAWLLLAREGTHLAVILWHDWSLGHLLCSCGCCPRSNKSRTSWRLQAIRWGEWSHGANFNDMMHCPFSRILAQELGRADL